MIKLKKGILAIIAGMACFVGLTDARVFADDEQTVYDASVTVMAVLDHITVTPVNQNVTLSTTKLQFTATAKYSNAPDKNITDSANWTSSNTTVASIELNTGLATILAIGSTTISAAYSSQSDNTTLTVSAANTSGGGGGGGGGGTSVITSLTEYTNNNGLVLSSATAESADGNVKLYLPQGTTVKNRSGQRLYSISIKPSSTPPLPPDDYKCVCLTYDIGPSGATFNPPIHLTLRYSDLQVPAGVNEERLVIATWQDSKWIMLEGCTVDKVKNTVTVPISHLTFFTVMAHTATARFEITGMTVNPDEVYPDESVTVYVTITNNGGLIGSYDVILKINNLALQTQKVTLGGGESQMISFTVTPDKSGEYTIDVNGLASNIKVKEPVPEGTVAEVSVPVSPSPASFTISDLSITPAEINPSEEVTVSAMVTNIGGRDGSYTVVLKIDDKEETRKEISLSPGQSERISFRATKDMVGNHTIDINGHAGQFTIKSPPPLLKPDRTLPLKPSTNGWAIIGIFIGSCCIIGILISLLKRKSWPY